MHRFPFEDRVAVVAAWLASAIGAAVIVHGTPTLWNVLAIYVPPVPVLWILLSDETRSFWNIILGALGAAFFGAMPVMMIASAVGIWW